MLLAIDIGNSSISIGVFQCTPAAGERPAPCLKAKLATDRCRSADEYAVILRSLLYGRGDGNGLSLPKEAITRVIIGSVVPPLTHTLQSAAEQLVARSQSHVPITVVSSGMRTGISLLVDDPGQLGTDIVSNAAAAVWLYGAPAITVDFGTATVISAINANRALLGVTIAPGVSISLDGLRTSAAQLPYIELKQPGPTLGKNTPASTRSGVVYGTACMVDGMIDRIIAETHLPPEVPILATGGLCALVAPHCRHSLVPEPDLTLLGLVRIATLTEERQSRRGKSGVQERPLKNHDDSPIMG